MKLDDLTERTVQSTWLRKHVSGRPFSLVLKMEDGDLLRLRAKALETSDSDDVMDSFEINVLELDFERSIGGYERILPAMSGVVGGLGKFYVDGISANSFARCVIPIGEKEAGLIVSGGDMPFTICVQTRGGSLQVGAPEFEEDEYIEVPSGFG